MSDRACCDKIFFDTDTPDGGYPYNPSGEGFFWRVLGTVLGTCASPYANESSKPELDCEMVRNATVE